MSMKFNILWFEDNEEWYETNKENIEEYLTGKNFVVDFKRYDSTDKINEVTAICEYDLILVDLKLDHNTKVYVIKIFCQTRCFILRTV